MNTNAKNFHELPKLIPALIFVVVALAVITGERKTPVKIEIVPASVTQAALSGAASETNITIVHDRDARLNFVPAKAGMNNGVQTGGLNSK